MSMPAVARRLGVGHAAMLDAVVAKIAPQPRSRTLGRSWPDSRSPSIEDSWAVYPFAVDA